MISHSENISVQGKSVNNSKGGNINLKSWTTTKLKSTLPESLSEHTL